MILEVFGIFWPFGGFKNILVIFCKLLSLFLMFLLLLLLFGYFEDHRGMFCHFVGLILGLTLEDDFNGCFFFFLIMLVVLRVFWLS